MDALTFATATAVGALVVGMVAVVTAQVFFRYVVGSSLAWAEEIARFFMIWMAFLGSALAVRYGGHIAIEVLLGLLGERLRWLVRVWVLAGLVILLAFLAKEAWDLNQRVWVQRTAALRLSVGYLYLAAPVGFALMALNVAYLLWEQLRGRDGTKALYHHED